VIIAHDLEPSQTIHFHKGKVLGVATDVGGRTSHSALLARSHGIPAVVGLRHVTRVLADGDLVAIDGFSGAVWPRPSMSGRNSRNSRFPHRISPSSFWASASCPLACVCSCGARAGCNRQSPLPARSASSAGILWISHYQ